MHWHEHAESFPLLGGEALEAFEQDVRRRGILKPIEFRVVNGRKQGIDGRNREHVARKLGIDCPEVCIDLADDDVVDYIDAVNEHRRHLTPEQQQERRVSRIRRVAAARANGQSARAIAEAEKISETQVRRDLEESDTPNDLGQVRPHGAPDLKDSVKPATITGRDGKKYPAQQPARSGGDCLVKRKTSPNGVHLSEDQESGGVAEQMKAVNTSIESFCRRVEALVKAECPHDPWLDDRNIRSGALRKFKDACDSLRTAKCAETCPQCEGEGCRLCLKTGRVPKWKYDQLV